MLFPSDGASIRRSAGDGGGNRSENEASPLPTDSTVLSALGQGELKFVAIHIHSDWDGRIYLCYSYFFLVCEIMRESEGETERER